MKLFLSLVLFFSSILSTWAQRSFIGLPLEGTKIKRGKNVTVQVARPNSLQGSTEGGLIIGLVQCLQFDGSKKCPSPQSQLGTILFNGNYNPQFHELPGRPYQNFTVKVPAEFPPGKAQLATARFHLIGAGPAPDLELNNVTVIVV